MFDLRFNYPLLAEEAKILQHVLQSMPETVVQQRLLLPPWRGLPEDRAIAAQWLSTQGGHISQEELAICASSHHALVVLLLAAELQGTTIVTDDFTYPGFKALARLFHLHLVPCETDEYGILPTSLAKLCTQRSIRAVYLQPTIHNPLGTIMPLQRRQELAETARRHKLLIIEDDAYRFLAAEAPPRFCDLVPEHTACIMSLAKPFSPALKIAYLVAPHHLAPALATAIQFTSSGASALLSLIASQVIHNGQLDQLIARKQADARLRQTMVRSILSHVPLQAHETSYHAWLSLPPGTNATQLAQNALKRGFVIIPGTEFAVASQDGEAHIRISLGGETQRDRLEQGLYLLHEELRT